MSEPTPEAKKVFDQAVIDKLRAAFEGVFREHPEVKTLAAAVTWNGGLNDAPLLHGIWLCPAGAVSTPDGIITSAQQTMKLLNNQLNRGVELVQHMQDQVLLLAHEIEKSNAELETLRTRQAVEGGQTPGAAPPPDRGGNP